MSAPKDVKKASKENKDKDSHGAKNERERDHHSKTENSNPRENKDQIVRDVKDAIKDAKDALKEYRQEESSKQSVSGIIKDKSEAPVDVTSDSSSTTTTATNNGDTKEIKSALSALQDIRTDSLPTKTHQEDTARESIDGNSSELSKADDEGAHSPGKDDKFSGAGSYIFNASENLDEYLKQLGVGLVFRKVQSVANPSLTIYPCKSNEWGIKMDSIFRTREVKFLLGEEFTDETFDGRPCRTVATLESANQLYIRQRCPTGPDVKVIYESHQNNSIKMTLISGSSKAVLHFIPNEEI